MLPRSSLTTALSRDSLPREPLVAAFVRACGADEDLVNVWLASRRRVAASPAVPAEPPRAAPLGAESVTEAPTQPGNAERHPDDTPPRKARPRRRRWIITAVIATVVASASFALLSGSGGQGESAEPTDSRETSLPEGVPAAEANNRVMSLRPPTVAEVTGPPAGPTDVAPVLYVGDSVAAETSGAVSYFVHSTGRATVIAETRSDAALCDFLVQAGSSPLARPTLHGLVRRHKPRVVALQFWGNSTTLCTAGAQPGSDDYFRRYETDVGRAVDEITGAAEAGGFTRPRIVWVLQGPDRTDANRTRWLNALYRNAAIAHHDLVADAGWYVSLAATYPPVPANARYTWTSHLPCTDLERQHDYCTKPEAYGGVTQLHPEDDDIHFCLAGSPRPTPSCVAASPGVIRYARSIAHLMVHGVG